MAGLTLLTAAAKSLMAWAAAAALVCVVVSVAFKFCNAALSCVAFLVAFGATLKLTLAFILPNCLRILDTTALILAGPLKLISAVRLKDLALAIIL